MSEQQVERAITYPPDLPVSQRRDEIAEAIEAVASGEQVVAGPPDADSSGDIPFWPGQDEGLTAREAEVLSLIAGGLSNNDVAARMGLSINSVKSYVRSSYRKIDVDSRSRAVLWGVEHGMRADRVRINGSPAREG